MTKQTWYRASAVAVLTMLLLGRGGVASSQAPDVHPTDEAVLGSALEWAIAEASLEGVTIILDPTLGDELARRVNGVLGPGLGEVRRCGGIGLRNCVFIDGVDAFLRARVLQLHEEQARVAVTWIVPIPGSNVGRLHGTTSLLDLRRIDGRWRVAGELRRASGS